MSRLEDDGAAADREMVTVGVQLSFDGQAVQGRLEVPKGPATWDDILPRMRSLVEIAVSYGVRRVEQSGQEITCRAGCGACCRQLVPIPEFEARRIAEVVRSMPQPRQSVVRERFAAACAQLETAGLRDILENKRDFDVEAAGRLGTDYFHQQIPCPFLEDESCSIYEERPIRCREYLVTTPAENCSNPATQPIQQVPLPLSVSAAASQLDAGEDSSSCRRWVALPLALDWGDADSPPEVTRDGPELLHEFLVKVTHQQPLDPIVSDNPEPQNGS